MLRKKSLMFFSLFIFVLSCNNEPKINFSDVTISTENNHLVEVNIAKAIENNAISKKINSEIERRIISSLQIGDPDNITSKSIEESIDNFNREFNDFEANFPNTVPKWEAQIDGEVMFQSPEIISIALTCYSFTGGAHGLVNISFLNFNAQTGNLIVNDYLFNNTDAFKTLAQTYFDKTVEDKNTLFEPTNFTLPKNIGYNEEGVVLLYNTYEIAPYSTGIIEFVVPFNEAEEYLVFNGF